MALLFKEKKKRERENHNLKYTEYLHNLHINLVISFWIIVEILFIKISHLKDD